jgi:tRNA threonylcarbamoyladenosine biosynthesis protein TsaE
MAEIVSRSVHDTINIGKRLARYLKAGDIVCLFGKFGSGKTVLTKGIASGLGIGDNLVISPSFVLIREYKRAKLPLYHFDLYRLKDEKDILGLGYEEYFYDDGVTVVEWADRLKTLLPKEYLKVVLKVKGERTRDIEIIPFGSRWAQLIKRL